MHVTPLTLPTPVGGGDQYTIHVEQAAIVLASQKDIITNFGIPKDIQSRFKGWKNPNYSDYKTMEQNAKE